MSRQVALADIRIGALRRIDQESAGYFSESEINDLANQSIAEWYEVQIGWGNELYLDSAPINLAAPVAGTTDTFVLPPTFFRLRGVDANISGQSFDLVPFNFNDRNIYKQYPSWTLGKLAAYRIMGNNGSQGPTNGVKYIKFIPAPGGTTSATVWFYPNSPQLGGDAESVDGSAGWEEYIILMTAAKMLIRQQRDPSTLLSLAGSEMTRIMSSAAKLDAAHPEHVSITRRWGARNLRRAFIR